MIQKTILGLALYSMSVVAHTEVSSLEGISTLEPTTIESGVLALPELEESFTTLSDEEKVQEVEVKGEELLFQKDSETNFAGVTVKEWVNAGLKLSRGILALAYDKTTSSTYNPIFLRDFTKLGVVTIHWPKPGYDFKACDEGTIAFTTLNGNDIYLCRMCLDESWFQVKELAQTLIHEGAHDIGYGNECDATKIEVSAMRASGVGIAFKNGYWARCGIK